LKVIFNYSRKPITPSILNVTASFINTTPSEFKNFDFQVAVPKFIKMRMFPPSSTTILPNGTDNAVTQNLELDNTMHGTRQLTIKIKIDYSVNGQPVSETGQTSNFPN